MDLFKLTTTVSLLLAMFLISGCGPGGNQMQTYDIHSGTKGISMSFVESMPPDSVFVGTDFSVGVTIKNEGPFSIDDRAELTIAPTDPTAFLFPQGDVQNFELGGKSTYIKEGEEDVIMFPIRAICFRGFDGTPAAAIRTIDTKLEATACYYYETEANEDICIDTQHHLRKPDETVACRMQDVTLSGGQGGPVGVTKIKVQPPLPQQESVLLQIPITIKKVAGPDTKIFAADVSSCNDFDRQDEVAVSVTLGGRPMRCEPDTIQLRARVDEPNILCEATLDTNLGAYKSPISINMRYYVSDTILHDIKSEAPPGQVRVSCDDIGVGAGLR